MVDKEIIKALECCKKLTHNGWGENQKICEEECPYKANCYDEEKNINMISDALDLINRQQAEIERLNEDKSFLKDEFERFRIRVLPIAKTEAIKEFAERLKEHLKGNGGLYCVTTMNAKIDNLVKEMVGEDK